MRETKRDKKPFIHQVQFKHVKQLPLLLNIETVVKVEFLMQQHCAHLPQKNTDINLTSIKLGVRLPTTLL